MKYSSFFLLIFSVTLVFSCGASKNTTAQTTTQPQVNNTPPPPRQGGRQGGGEFGQQRAELMAALNLSDDQKTKFEEIEGKYRAQMREMRENNQGADRSAMLEKMRGLRQQQNTEVKEILNEDQMKVYQEFMQQRRQNRGRRGNN